jgi:hypothetical protein
MGDRSTGIYGMAHAATEKFDYFICSVTGALFAYIAQTYQPQKIDNIFSILQTLSLLILFVSFFSGIRRIQLVNLNTRINHAMLQASEKAGKITTALIDYRPADSFHNQASGERTNREDLERKRADYIKEANKMEANLPVIQSKAVRCGRVRDVFLLLGFVTIFSSKILQPYQLDPSHRSHATAPANNTTTQSMPPGLNHTNK